MDKRRRAITILLSLLAVCLGLAALILKVGVDPNRYRPQVIAFFEAKTGKKIEIGRIEVNWLSGTVRLYDFGTRNPEPFPNGYFFKADCIDGVLDFWALLHREIELKSVAITNPTINVISDPDGLWNFENPGMRTGQAQPILGLGVIPRVTITGGHLLGSSLIDPSDRPGPVVFEVHNLAVTLNNANFDAFTGPTSAPVGEGTLSADSLRLGSIVVTKLKSQLLMRAKEVFFENASMNADRGHAKGKLTFNLSGKAPRFDTKVMLTGIDVKQLLTRFPGGRGKMTGTMDGDIAFRGDIEHTLDPLAGISGQGRFIVRNGDLPNLNSNENLKKLARFRDPQDASRSLSSFSILSSDLQLGHQRMTSHDVNISFYGVDLQCSGDIDLVGDNIHYQGLLKLMKKQGFFTSVLARAFREAKEQDGKLVFPIQISGTLAAPKFVVED